MSRSWEGRCWPEGTLRAHLDRELPPEEMEQIAAHLKECAECERRSAELAVRAERVDEWMAILPAPELEWAAPAPRPVAPRRWIGLAAALAAGLLLAVWLLPRHQAQVPGPAPVAVTTTPAAVPATELPTTPSKPAEIAAAPAQNAAVPKKVRRRRAPAVRSNEEFLALDDEPIETGVVMRVGVEPGNVQADIVFGPDGRAHAIRLVSDRN